MSVKKKDLRKGIAKWEGGKKCFEWNLPRGEKERFTKGLGRGGLKKRVLSSPGRGKGGKEAKKKEIKGGDRGYLKKRTKTPYPGKGGGGEDLKLYRKKKSRVGMPYHT